MLLPSKVLPEPVFPSECHRGTKTLGLLVRCGSLGWQGLLFLGVLWEILADCFWAIY